MFALAFVGAGLFANASNFKIKKVETVKRIEMKESKTANKTADRGSYSFTLACSNGNAGCGCCYATAEAALAAMVSLASQICAAQP